jgi:hypothetical protein
MITRTASLALALVVSLAGSASSQEPGVPADTIIRLQRTSCFGPCPIYTVTIDAGGTVTYEGTKFVRVVGRQTARVSPQTVATLLSSAGRIRFFDLNDAYRVIPNPDGTVTTITDLPTTIVTISVNGRTKGVEDYVGAPDGLAEFEDEIDAAAGTRRWIFLDEETLGDQIRSGWSASSGEGAALLRQAIDRDDVGIARLLIENGADVQGPAENRTFPLSSARSGAMVDLLVHAGADPNERPAGRGTAMTPLMITAYKDVGVAEALLRAGARLDDRENDRSALWYAACAGNWRVVAVLLGAGADARGSTDIPAVDCARQERQNAVNRPRPIFARGQPTVADFDRAIALLENAEQRIK